MKKRYLIPIIILVLIGLVGYICREKSYEEIYEKYMGKNIEVVTRDLNEPIKIYDCENTCNNDGVKLYTYEITRTTGTCLSCVTFDAGETGEAVFTVNDKDVIVKVSIYFN